MDAIAWCNSKWGDPNELGIPISDRGLRLAEGVFETVLLVCGEAQLLDQHLERWYLGALHLGLPNPPAKSEIKTLIATAIERSGIKDGALRLNWSQGNGGGRGLALSENDQTGRLWGSLHRYKPTFQMQTIIISKKIKVWADSALRHYKTFAYGEMALARREASTAGCQDALMLSSAGGLCCATSANLLVQRQGRWITPSLASGCLPGIMRAAALQQGRATESQLGDALIPGEAAVLLNSLDCRPITPEAVSLAEPLFRNLLKESEIKGQALIE